MKKRIISLLLALIMIFSLTTQVIAVDDNQIEDMVNTTQEFMYTNISEPNVGTVAGEWTVLSLARSDAEVPEEYFNDYYNRVENYVKEKSGKLTKNKFTEYSRLIVALTSIGKDVKNVAGYNLLEPLSNFDNVIKQGINGPIWALIAFDTKNFEIPRTDSGTQNSRETMINYILDLEITDKNGRLGGWALTGDKPDPDITAMAIYAFSPYVDSNTKVKAAVERALEVLSDNQLQNGGYISWGTENSESVAQVIIALTSLGIDPSTDKRFIKYDADANPHTTLDALSQFYVSGGGFKHIKEGKRDGIATDQGVEGFISYLRFKKGKTYLFDMSDVKVGKTDTSALLFSDIENHWAKDLILDTKGYGISNSEKEFKPDKPINRGEFAVGIVNGFKLTPGEKTVKFDDVKESDWYYSAVQVAASNGIIEGKGYGKYDPKSNITREEAMTMIYRLFELKGKDMKLNSNPEELVEKFPDGKEVSDWAKKYVAYNIQNEIIEGRLEGIVPKGNITRAEAVTVINRSTK